MDDEAVRDFLIDELDSAYPTNNPNFGGKASEFFDWNANKVFVQNYATEPFIEMATKDRNRPFVDVNNAGALNAFDRFFNKPVDGKIWFAGDYTRYDGNQSGESGKDAARFLFDKVDCNEPCVDNPTWRSNGNNPKDCAWVANNRFHRCNRRGTIVVPGGRTRNRRSGSACPAACQVCLKNVCPN